jgi:GNAT superfamily N-acetyltransferase
MTPVTISYLEMLRAEDMRGKPGADPHFRILECTVPQWQFNQFLYRMVGEAWHWHEKQSWGEHQWRHHAESPNLRTFAAYYEGSPAGYYELSTTGPRKEVEILYFGLLPAFLSRGFGGVLLTHALGEAWNMNPARVWVHTCSLDHPAALQNYLARGFTLYKTEVVPATLMAPEAPVASEPK